MRGGIRSLSGRTGATPWSEFPVSGRAEVPPESGLPLKRILYIPFRIFAYSSNIVMNNLVRIESMLTEGTLKYSRFSLNSTSFRDLAPATKLRWCTTQPECCMTNMGVKKTHDWWLINLLTFSTQHIQWKHNTWLKAGVGIVGILSWRDTWWMWRVRCLWCSISVSPVTVLKVVLTLIWMDTYITLMI